MGRSLQRNAGNWRSVTEVGVQKNGSRERPGNEPYQCVKSDLFLWSVSVSSFHCESLYVVEYPWQFEVGKQTLYSRQ
jgi:hypothetical protein